MMATQRDISTKLPPGMLLVSSVRISGLVRETTLADQVAGSSNPGTGVAERRSRVRYFHQALAFSDDTWVVQHYSNFYWINCTCMETYGPR